MKHELSERNLEQIQALRAADYLRKVTDETLERIREEGKAMLVMCSDGRYTADIMKYIERRTGVCMLQLYCHHGGALVLAKNPKIVEVGSTQKDDVQKMMAKAYFKMGYKLCIKIWHGPECAAMADASMDVLVGLDESASANDELWSQMHDLEIIDLFHADRNGELNLYEYDAAAWTQERGMFLQRREPLEIRA